MIHEKISYGLLSSIHDLIVQKRKYAFYCFIQYLFLYFVLGSILLMEVKLIDLQRGSNMTHILPSSLLLIDNLILFHQLLHQLLVILRHGAKHTIHYISAYPY